MVCGWTVIALAAVNLLLAALCERRGGSALWGGFAAGVGLAFGLVLLVVGD